MILRAHHILCILGFRGKGYSKEFVRNMTSIIEQLRANPDTVVKIVDSPDDICPSCPFTKDTGCNENGPQSEAAIKTRDQNILRKIALETGTELSWKDILKEISDLLSVDDIRNFCENCQWLSLGFCIEGLEQLKAGEW